jgi:hypothetical protein
MKLTLFVLTLMTTVNVAFCATWYVDASVSESGEGTSLTEALKSIQEGIDAASEGDIVVVAEGTYIENIQFKGKNIVLRSTDPANPTVVEKTIIDGGEAASVVTFAGTEDDTCVLSGFTIRNGLAEQGAGIHGGVFPDLTHATIQNNTITDNSADQRGGGLLNCEGTIHNNTITGNSAERGGGLCYCDGTIHNNTIADNSAECGGGLAYCGGTIQNNTIVGNWAYVDGGGLRCCSGTIQNKTITGLWALGGGLYSCGGTIQNNTIAGNSAGQNGGGLYLCGGIIQNNTITGNWAYRGGGLSSCDGTIQNCILWGNTAQDEAQLYGGSTPTYSCIQDWSGGGERNITQPPQFVDAAGSNYRLSANSPCIDAGNNEDWMADAVDLDGKPRIINGTVDMGAYEYGSQPFKVVRIRKAAGGGTELTWNSRWGDTYVVLSGPMIYCPGPICIPWAERATLSSQGLITSWTDSTTSYDMLFYRVKLMP